MSVNNKNTLLFKELDEINLQDEDGFVEIKIASVMPMEAGVQPNKAGGFRKILHAFLRIYNTKPWYNNDNFTNKYLKSVQYAFEKGDVTTKKVSGVLNKIPDLNSKRLIQITLIFL